MSSSDDSDCSVDSIGTVYTVSDVSDVSVVIYENRIYYDDEYYSTLDRLPPYRVVKGEVDNISAEVMAESRNTVRGIFQSLIDQSYKATGDNSCWNQLEICEHLNEAPAGEGVLCLPEENFTIAVRDMGPHPLNPAFRVLNTANVESDIQLTPQTLYIIEGQGSRRDEYLASSEVLAKALGLKRCLLRPLPGEATRVSLCGKVGLYQGKSWPRGKEPEGDYSYEKRGRRKTFLINDNYLAGTPTVKVYSTGPHPRIKRRKCYTSEEVASVCGKEVLSWKQIGKLSQSDPYDEYWLDSVWRSRGFSANNCLTRKDASGPALARGVYFTQEMAKKHFLETSDGRLLLLHKGEIGRIVQVGTAKHFEPTSCGQYQSEDVTEGHYC